MPAVGGLDGVTVTVRKDPSAWKGTAAERLVAMAMMKSIRQLASPLVVAA